MVQLFLERYLDEPIERVLGGLTGLVLPRERFRRGWASGCRSAGSQRAGDPVFAQANAAGYEWVVFYRDRTAGTDLYYDWVLPLLALARADPAAPW